MAFDIKLSFEPFWTSKKVPQKDPPAALTVLPPQWVLLSTVNIVVCLPLCTYRAMGGR